MKPHRVLVVEDDEATARIVKILLERNGFEAAVAVDGAKALEQCAAMQPDLVLLDLMLPLVDGISVLKAIKGADPLPDPVVILFTAIDDIDTRVKALGLGADDFVAKPFQPQELLARIRTHSRHKRLREQLQLRNQELEALSARVARGFERSIRLLSDLIEQFNAELGGHGKRAALLARELGAELGLSVEEIDSIGHAARLMDIGLIGLPPQLANKSEDSMNVVEQKIYWQHPALGYDLLKNVDGLEHVAQIVRHHHERYAGGGYPDGLQGDHIPIGSRVLAVAARFEREVDALRRGGHKDAAEALYEVLKLRHQHLDPAIVDTLKHKVIPVPHPTLHERRVPLGKLAPGMRLSRDVKSAEGRLLLARGVTLTSLYIEKLVNYDRLTPLIEDIFVDA